MPQVHCARSRPDRCDRFPQNERISAEVNRLERREAPEIRGCPRVLPIIRLKGNPLGRVGFQNCHSHNRWRSLSSAWLAGDIWWSSRIAFLVTGFRPAKGGLPVVMRRILLRSGERLWKKVTRRLMVGRNCDIAALFPSPSHFLFGSCRAVGRKINHLRIRPAFYTIWRVVRLHPRHFLAINVLDW